YEMLVQVAESLENPGKNTTITVASPGSEQYKKYYYQLETALADSCSSMRQVVSNSNEESENSSSKNPKAIKYYEEGVDYMKEQDYKKAVLNFKKAVETDSMFSFAWDNLGVCNRKLGNLDDALHAYRQSLKINPYGKLPLQNIPIVYLYKKEYDKAILEYQHLANVYPDDPETFYGIGNVLINYKEEYEEGLRYMCKAYNMYIQLKSPYRVDAEKQINFIYAKMKEAGKEKRFFEILKENNINPE
ncbi:MAG: tetratricopeptide repeat protein, partial [Chitinophagaceae bacterium]|nr:tetratricopeptide repeat protein [Chitinophagaceae bacterium]